MNKIHKKCDYYVIDFETASASLTSACSVGIIGVKNDKIELEEYHLINPQEPFSDFNISIHHITPKDVLDSLSFDLLWEKIKIYFENTIVFSHFSGFDFNVLRALLDKYHLIKPIFRFGCTVRLARLVWNDGEVANHKLNTMAGYLGLEFNHHHALSDASVCVYLIQRALKITQEDNVVSMYTNLSLRFGYFGPKRFFDTYQLKVRSKKQQPKIDNPALLDKVVILSGIPVSLKRSELTSLIIANGGYVDSVVDVKCDYFVKLKNFKEEKLNQALRLVEGGMDITIINEAELVKLVRQ